MERDKNTLCPLEGRPVIHVIPVQFVVATCSLAAVIIAVNEQSNKSRPSWSIQFSIKIMMPRKTQDELRMTRKRRDWAATCVAKLPNQSSHRQDRPSVAYSNDDL